MTLVPFNRDFNRMLLRVSDCRAPNYRVSWMNHQNMLEEWHIYPAAELMAGINLAEDFPLNPVSSNFHRLDDLIFQKQTIESKVTWHAWEGEGKTADAGLSDCEAQRDDVLRQIQRAFVPVTHNIRIEPIA